jgi:integrase/recombinase XerD
MDDELKDKILIHNGIIASEIKKKKPSILNCPRCDLMHLKINIVLNTTMN